jgi:hypothetical protein
MEESDVTQISALSSRTPHLKILMGFGQTPLPAAPAAAPEMFREDAARWVSGRPPHATGESGGL